MGEKERGKKGKRSRETEEGERNKKKEEKRQEKKNRRDWEWQREREHGERAMGEERVETEEGREEDKRNWRMTSHTSGFFIFFGADVAHFSPCYLWFWDDQYGEEKKLQAAIMFFGDDNR